MKSKNSAVGIFLTAAILLASYCRATNAQELATVKIGDQTWCVKNLTADKYRNGDPIPQVQDSAEWSELKTGAWCYYNNDSKYSSVYGKFYNWYAVNDPRGLAPEGYHIPNKEEWAELIEYVGEDASSKLKSTSYWIEGNGTNTSGFTGVPGGSRVGYGTDARMGGWGRWWSSSDFDNRSATLFLLDYVTSSPHIYSYDKRCGFSVRCIKD